MNKKTAHEPKMFTKNTNQKKTAPGVSTVEPGGSLLKKNEFTMILLAALVATALVFFFFFWESDTPQKDENAPGSSRGLAQATPGFENRISALEISLAKIASSSGQKNNRHPAQAVVDLEERVSRIETAVNLKLDALIERVDKFESRLNKLAVVASAPPRKVVVKPKPTPKPTPKLKPKNKKPAAATAPKKKVQTIKKKTKKPKTTSLFHTVQKGETLWSVSQKYKTTVAAIRKLNNLTPEDKIYPGSNLLVK